MRNLQGILALALLLIMVVAMWLMLRMRAASAPPPAQETDVPAMTESAADLPAIEGEEAGATVETVVLVGRILDAQGLPFQALRVVLSCEATGPREIVTDQDGAFKFRSIPRAPITLDLSADFDAAEPLGRRTLACRVQPLALDLAAEPDLGRRRFDVGTHVLPRSRPCWIQGQVLLDEDWARSKELLLSDVRIELENPNLAEPGGDALAVLGQRPGAPTDWSAPPWRRDLPPFPTLKVDGTFRFAVETPHDPFMVVARLEHFEPDTKLLHPVPDRVLTETFALPQP